MAFGVKVYHLVAFVAFLVSVVSSVAVAQPYSIELIAPWGKTGINVLVKDGPSFAVNATLKALGIWKKAISYASETYSWASPLRRVKLTVYVEGLNDTLPSYDMVIGYVNAPSGGLELGVTRPFYDRKRGVIERMEITLYLKYPGGYALMSYNDIYNVALHEIGHGLGLGHANVNATENGFEVMYPYYLGREKMTPSTLDLYGLAQVFSHRTLGDMPRRATLPGNVRLRNILVYYVDVRTEHGGVSGYGRYIWGDVATVELTDTRVYGKDVGYVFVRWVGTISSTSPRLVFRVTGNVTLTAVWKKIYRVAVVDVGGEREYWVPEGERLNLSFSSFVYLPNGTRMRFLEVEPIGSREAKISLTVASPMRLTVSRTPEYLVTVDTVLFGEKTYWVGRGGCFSPEPERGRLVFDNGTIIVFEGWRPSVEGCVRISGPLRLVAVWKRMYRVVLEGKEVYVEEGGVLKLNSSPVVEKLSDGVARGVYAWLVGGKEVGGGRLIVEKPLTIEPVYKKSFLSGVCVLGYFGGRIELNSTWVDNCSEEWLFGGTYVVRGVGGNTLGKVRIESPGMRYVVAPVALLVVAVFLAVFLSLIMYLRKRHV